MMRRDREATHRRLFASVAVISGSLSAGLFLVGLGKAYLYEKQGSCPPVLGWWSVGASAFWPALALSVVFWASLVMAVRRFRGVALFGAGLALGLWLWFGGTSAVQESHRQRAYRIESGMAANAPLPDWARSTDRTDCSGGG
jgi:hypothetical protein